MGEGVPVCSASLCMWCDIDALKMQEGLTVSPGRPASSNAAPARASAKSGNRKSNVGEQPVAKGKGKAGDGNSGVPEAIAKLPVAAAAAKLRARTMREHSSMEVSAKKALDAFSRLSLSKLLGDGEVENEDERSRSIRARHELLLRFTSQANARTKDAASVKVQAELHEALKKDNFFDELSLTENWGSDSCWTMGMIGHFRQVEMELLGSSSQVYNRHLVCEMAMNIITRVSKALLQDVQQWEANQQAETKALKEEEAARKMLVCTCETTYT